MTRPLRLLLAVLGAGLLIACGKPDSERIFGHWRAERLQLQGLSVPMGPEFVVSRTELRSVDGDVRIPIASVTADGDAVTLDMPLGLGLQFQFDGADRVAFDMPLVGKLYYRRVSGAVQAAQSPVQPSAAVQSVVTPSAADPAVAHTPRMRPPETELPQQDDPMRDYNLCIARVRQGDTDGAVRSLRDAFQHGFRDFALLESAPDLAPLKNDPRYMALVTRYR
jgi:hypothetical protein